MLAKRLVKQKDPGIDRKPESTSAQEVKLRQSTGERSHVQAETRRMVFQQHECCQWKDPITGVKCSSKFQLQLDHIQPIWDGGSNDPSNLQVQVLCSVHNREKYRREAGIKRR